MYLTLNLYILILFFPTLIYINLLLLLKICSFAFDILILIFSGIYFCLWCEVGNPILLFTYNGEFFPAFFVDQPHLSQLICHASFVMCQHPIYLYGSVSELSIQFHWTTYLGASTTLLNYHSFIKSLDYLVGQIFLIFLLYLLSWLVLVFCFSIHILEQASQVAHTHTHTHTHLLGF